MKGSEAHWLEHKREREASRSEIAAALTALGAQVGGRDNLRCPFHDDKHPSATLKQVDGKWYFSCHASSCSVVYDIWAVTAQLEGRNEEEVLKEFKKEVLDEYDRLNKTVGAGKGKTDGRRTQKAASGFTTIEDLISHVLAFRNSRDESLSVERKHPYRDPDNADVVPLYVFRLRDQNTGKKSYTQAYLAPNGRYVTKKADSVFAGDKLLPLYNRKRLKDAENVLVVEGEWAVEAFTRLGIEGWAATTTPGGAGKSEHCDLTPLANKNVYVWADNDPYDEKLGRHPGLHHMQQIVERVQGSANVVKRVLHEELDLPEKGDIVDYLAQCKDPRGHKAMVGCVLLDAEKVSRDVTENLLEQFEEIAAGRYKHLQFPDSEALSTLSKAGYPKTVTLMCSEPSAGKSYWVLEKAWKLHEQGFKIKVLMLEEDHVYWQNRVLAQMAGNSNLGDIDWVSTHSAEAIDLLKETQPRLNSFVRRLDVTEAMRPSLLWVAEWVEQAAAEGNEYIFVDPVTAAAGTTEGWIDDHEFLFAVKTVTQQTGARLFLTTHPRGDTKGKPSLDNLAGGRAYPRFSQTVFWLRKLDKPEKGNIDPMIGPLAGDLFDYTYEREIQIRKARNGRGNGANIATVLDPNTLCFVELGKIVNLD